jgi:hypothetical protein
MKNENDQAAYAAGTTARFQATDWSYLCNLSRVTLEAALKTPPQSQRERAEHTAIRVLLGIELADSWEDEVA